MNEKTIIELVKITGECIGFLAGIDVINNSHEAQIKINDFHKYINEKFKIVISYVEQKESAS